MFENGIDLSAKPNAKGYEAKTKTILKGAGANKLAVGRTVD